MRRLATVALLLLAGCAPRQPDAVVETVPSPTRISTPGGNIDLATVSSSTAIGGVVPAPAQRVWEVLPAVYEELRVPVTTVKSDQYVIGNPGAKVRRSLGGTPMQRYLECGSGSGGPNAETYLVTLSLHTQLVPVTEDETRVLTTVDASATPPSFGNSSAVRCASSGQLERRIAALVAERLRM
jgi:hypothetical protein